MKCESIASLWSSSPPSHQVTAAVTFPEPPSLYTGASDGSIVWWKLPGDQTTLPSRPRALLCGHSASISALSPCSPFSSPALFSTCTDAVLCIWSAATGHCRRRRKLPTWVGSPTAAASLPCSPRYVCVAFSNAASDPDHHDTSRIAVLVVDSCALSIVQTVAHGSMLLEHPSFARVAMGPEGDAVVLSDNSGNVEVFGIQQKDNESFEGGFRRSVSAVSTGETTVTEGAVWLDVRGMLMSVVFGDRCVFRSVAGGSTVGEILLRDDFLRPEDRAIGTRFAGGMFLQDNGSPGANAEVRFMLWCSDGAAVLYAVRGCGVVDDVFEGDFFFEPVCAIPPHSSEGGGRVSFIFCESGSSVLRIRSCCFPVLGSSVWRPLVTAWTVPDLSTGREGEREVVTCTLLGEACFPVSWNDGMEEGDAFHCGGTKLTRSHVVTSSMVLSENSFAPYGIVYGFDNGEIELTRFWNSFLDLDGAGERKHSSSSVIKQSFFGHTGAVVCLAARRMVAKSTASKELGFALVSGSLDCTVRIWAMNTGNVVAVLHHHVAPVRQIILPPPLTFRPWNDCFLSVGEDGCVALISLETIRVERMFPGHPSYPSRVVWDSARGYVACLCEDVAPHPDAAAALCIWDVNAGARERVLHGAASFAMFDHFCGRVNVNGGTTGNVFGRTSTPSLLHLPFVEGVRSPSDMGAQTKEKEKYIGSGDDIRNVDITNVNHPPVNSAKENSSRTRSGPSKLTFLQTHDKNKTPAVECSCPLPGIAVLKFDIASIMSPGHRYQSPIVELDKNAATTKVDYGGRKPGQDPPEASNDSYGVQASRTSVTKESMERNLILFSIAFLHLWDIDSDLDALLMDGMNIFKPDGLLVASGIPGDRGSLTLSFPGLDSSLELWKSSSEFSAMRSLTIVSLAQRLIALSHESSTASSALAAFYTRKFAEKVPSLKPPLLQILVSFWQDNSDHVRMAARSLFHCAAPRAVPVHLQ